MDPSSIIGNWVAKEVLSSTDTIPQNIPSVDQITLSFDDMGMFELAIDTVQKGECVFTGTEFWMLEECALNKVERGMGDPKELGIFLVVDGDSIILDFKEYKIKFGKL